MTLCEACEDGCDIANCHDCGEDYTDPCSRHRAAGHVPSNDPYTDDVDCHSCCAACHGASVAYEPAVSVSLPEDRKDTK